MSLDRRMQFFIEEMFPIIWTRYRIPVQLTHPSEPSGFNCRDISPELIELCGKAIWVQSKIVFHHWMQFMSKYKEKMVSSPKAFVTYVTYACNVTAYNITDHYERFISVCALLAGFGGNFFYSGHGMFMKYIPKILAVFFERNMSAQFNTRGGWKRLDKYLLRQDYLSWHDETLVPDETNDQKLVRELKFSKKIETAIKASYVKDYDVDRITEKDIEYDLEIIRVTDAVMEYFPEPPSVESEVVKMMEFIAQCETDDYEKKNKIIDFLGDHVRGSHSPSETNPCASKFRKLTHQAETNQQTGKKEFRKQSEIGGQNMSTSAGNIESVSSKKRRKLSKKKKQGSSWDLKDCEFAVSVNKDSSPICNPQSAETSINKSDTVETSTQVTTIADSDDESITRNRPSSKETNRRTTPEKPKDEFGFSLLDAYDVERKVLNIKPASIPSSPNSVEDSDNKMSNKSNKMSVNLDCSNILSGNNQNSKETGQNTKSDELEKNTSCRVRLFASPTRERSTTKEQSTSISNIPQSDGKNSKQDTSVNLRCIQPFSNNPQPEEIKQKKTGDVPNVGSISNNDQPTEEETKSEIIQETSPDETEMETISTEFLPRFGPQKAAREDAAVQFMSDMKRFTPESNEQTEHAHLKNNEFPSEHQKCSPEKLPKTPDQTQTSSTISMSNSKKEAMAEIISIVEPLASKLEEFAIVLGSVLWDLRHDIEK